MKLKRFEEGGSFTELGGSMDIIGGGIKSIYGIQQLRKANREYDRAKAAAPSLETPGQFYENYKNAYDSAMARIETDAIQGNLATSIQALQGAGGRALVGGLGAATAQAQNSQNRMLAQERMSRMRAGESLARAEDFSIGRKEKRSQNELNQAQASAAAARQNIVGGITDIATGAMAGGFNPISSAAKKAAGFMADTPSKFRDFMVKQEIKKTKNAIGTGESSENMNQFILNQNDYIKSVSDSWSDYNKPEYGFNGKQERMPILDETLDRSKMMEEQFITDQKNQASPVQDVTSGRVGAGGGIVSGIPSGTPSEKEMQYRQGQIGNTPTKNGFIGPNGEFIAAPVEEYPFNVKPVSDKNNGGMMTEGSFNHNSNPIDIVQNGVKVAEATGNEYILNPEQAAKIRKESSFARKLFKQFEKKAKSNK
tara:strand:+ start:1165 stop:2439 length:1275 start_codon:yes stop_codon:yes gene_type:complete